MTFNSKTQEFRKALENLSREDLLEIIRAQDPELIKTNKVKHCLFCTTQEIFDWYINNYE